MHSSVNGRIALISLACFAVSFAFDLLMISLQGTSYAQMCSWDCRDWYVSILNEGYYPQQYVHTQGEAANWAFFPLFPLLAAAVRAVFGIPPDLALVVTGKLAFLFSIMAFLKMCHVYDRDANLAVCGGVLVASPYAIYAHTGYTEPLFLLLTCMTFVLMKQRRYILAGLCGGALSAVRTVGVAAALSYAYLNLRTFIGIRERRIDILLGAMLIPLGLSLFMVYLHHTMGDAMAFSHIQKAWDRSIQNPVGVILNSIGPNAVNTLYLANLAVAFVMIAWLLRAGLHELAIFSLFCTLIPLSTGIWSLPRYLWWQAPLLFAVAQVLRRKWVAAIVLPLLFVGQIFMYRAWFRGEWYVI